MNNCQRGGHPLLKEAWSLNLLIFAAWAALLLTGGGIRAAETVPLIDSSTATSGARTNYGGTLGVQFRFTGTTGGKATELGIFDGNAVAGLRVEHLVRLYGMESAFEISATLLGGVTVPAGARGASTNSYVYAALAEPVTLTNGAWYVVVADYPTNDTVDPFFDIGPNNLESRIAAGFASRFSDSTGNPGTFVPHHDFPNVYNPVLAAYGGPNLKIEPFAEPPLFEEEPISRIAYAGHRASFSATVLGSPPIAHQWQGGPDGGPYTNLANSARINGATSNKLEFTSIEVGDRGEYRLIATNAYGAATSLVAQLSVVPAPAGVTNLHPYAAAVLALEPMAYWRLNDPSSTELLYDSAGGYDAQLENLALGVAGLRPPANPGFSAGNTAAYFDGFSSTASSGVPLMNGLGSFTVMGWFSPAGPNSDLRTGLFGQNDALELGYNDTEGISLWFPVAGNWFHLVSGPEGFAVDQWHFVAVSARENAVTIYVNGSQRAQLGGVPSGSSRFEFKLGGGGIFDPEGNFFNGVMEDVAVLDYGLTRAEIQRLYGAAVGFFAPIINQQPGTRAARAGAAAEFTVGAEGGELAYQWQHRAAGGAFAELPDGGGISGAREATLRIAGVGGEDLGDYRVTVRNRAGEATSEPAGLTILAAPAHATFPETVLSMNPVAYWRFEEAEDPAAGTVRAHDHAGQFHGTYGSATLNGSTNYNVAGPRPEDGFKFFEADNKAIRVRPGTNNSWVNIPPLLLNTNIITVTAWVKPLGDIPDYSAILFARGGGEEIFGLGFGGGLTGTQGRANYTWTSAIETWGWPTFLFLTNNSWSFITLTVADGDAWVYKDGEPISRNFGQAHPVLAFSAAGAIGADLLAPLERAFNGLIDEVAVFNYFLLPDEIRALYRSAVRHAPDVAIAAAEGGGVTLSWAGAGLLQSAATIEGRRTLWHDEGTNSPVTLPAWGQVRFFRVLSE